ncbi:MAG: type IV pilus assembly protein PilM [Armatimonadetes bacterium]|jgi:type IV pilus assembly protein PilM|nr:type IV pilus assembly protein PilM [Armatimonadota bacterium]
MGLFGGDSVIGLDIGTSSIKAVKMQATKGGWEVVAAARVPTPAGTLIDGQIADEEQLVPVLRQLLTRSAVRGSEVVAAVNYTAQVAVRRTTLPVMTPTALRKQLRANPEQFQINSGKEFATDFEVVSLQGEGEAAQMDTVIVSAPRTPVDSCLHLLERAGLDPIALDIEPFALMRSLVECKPAMLPMRSATAVLDLGAVHTDITVVRGPNYIFTRAIPFAGEGFTEVVRQAMQCSTAEAEALKTQVDLTWLLHDAEGRKETPEYQATVAIKPVLDDLLKEVRNSILFYQSQLPDEDLEGMVGAILLAGGTALMGGLAEYMQAAFALEVERADFTQGFAYSIAAGAPELVPDTAPLFALALGLAAKEPQDQASAAAAKAQLKAATKARPGKRRGQAAAPTATPTA